MRYYTISELPRAITRNDPDRKLLKLHQNQILYSVIVII